jgi:uncharacterized protein YutE (UPF0331/DUF86 family)
MVLKRDTIEQRLKELNKILQELNKYGQIEREALQKDLSQRWIIERGLIAAASIILEIADHILAGHFGIYIETYEESLEGLQNNEVISATLYQQIKGLGGFRNILVHGYLGLDTAQVFDNFQKGLVVFPLFAQEILEWLEAQFGA